MRPPRLLPWLVVLVALVGARQAAAYVTVVATGQAYSHRSASFGPELAEEGVWGTAVSLRSVAVGND
jgi:hypothetical protein